MHGSIAARALPDARDISSAGRGSLPPADDAPLGRAMLVTGSVGSGHTRAAEAVADAMLVGHAANEAVVVDCLAHAVAPFRRAYRDAYIALIERAPGAIGWLYRSSDRAGDGPLRRAVQRHALASFRRRVRDERPDTIVCTHFLAAEVVSDMVARGEWRGRFAVVVTDFDAHAMWAKCPHADRWFVALEETREILAGKGVPRERVEITGIPISAAFSAPAPSRAELRRTHGLSPEGPALLVSGGGVGVSLLGDTLLDLLRVRSATSIVLVCGKNARLRERAETVVGGLDSEARARVRILGFTDRMHELMRACDLAIGKPGGLTSCEALACGLPMAVLRPVPGQEERNSDHLLEWGVATKLNSPESLAWRLDALLSDGDRLARMRAAALARARPFAADAVVDGLCRLAAG
jgi:processive 1,2-diacylglycerol beta-glucosyltransferase